LEAPVVDTETALMLFGSAQLAGKLLGPTVDYLGEGMREWAEARMANLRSIFRKAESKLGDQLEKDGAVSPRVLKGILAEGSFWNDELASEYFGGVLASARSRTGRDDRGTVWISLISRLSTYQLRSHYIFYSIMRRLWMRPEYLVQVEAAESGVMRGYIQWETPEAFVFIPYSVYEAAMEIVEDESVDDILHHVMPGLWTAGLIGTHLRFGSKRSMENRAQDWLREREPSNFAHKKVTLPSGGIILSPSHQGLFLYLWAHGQGNLHGLEFFNPEVAFELVSPVEIPAGAGRLIDFTEELAEDKRGSENSAPEPPVE
jgi:hypothetical protein